MVFSVLVLGALVAAVATAAFVPLLSRAALRRGWVDNPDNLRKLHARATPNIGGLAIAAGGVLGLVYLVVLDFALPSEMQLPPFAFWVGALAMIAAGFYDDIRGLGFKGKFVIQAMVAYLLLCSGYRIDVTMLPFVEAGTYEEALYSIPVTMIWIVGIINAVNLLDGVDGLAAGVCAIAFAGFALIVGSHGEIGLALLVVPIVGALLGFLVHNFNPASIFMGDSGSLLLGYMLAVYSMKAQTISTAKPSFFMLIPIVVLGLPVLDTGLSIVRRASRGHAIFAPDSDHIHHRLVRRYSVKRAVIALYGVAILFGSVALLMSLSTVSNALLLLFGTLLLVSTGLRRLGYSPVKDYRSLRVARVTATNEPAELAWGDGGEGAAWGGDGMSREAGAAAEGSPARSHESDQGEPVVVATVNEYAR